MNSKLVGILATVALVAALLWLLTKSTTDDETPARSDKDKPMKAALITKGPVSGSGWAPNAYKGLQRIHEELGAEIRNVVAAQDNEALAHFQAYSSTGCQVVIGHASEWFNPKLLEVAKANPKVRYLISGSEKDAVENVAGMRFVLEDACYVLGFLAGSMTRSGVLGCVGPVKIPVIASTFDAFAQGAKAAKPDVDVRVVWTDSWSDIAAAKEKTRALLGEKADFIFHNANDGAPGVFEAVQEKKDQGVLVFGANDDQSAQAPDVILASAVLDIPKCFADVVRKIKEGTFDGKTQILGLAEGYVWVAYNKQLESKIPADVRKKADELVAKIKDRSFKVERLSLK